MWDKVTTSIHKDGLREPPCCARYDYELPLVMWRVLGDWIVLDIEIIGSLVSKLIIGV